MQSGISNGNFGVWVRLGGNSNLLIYLVAEAGNKSSLAIERVDIGVTTFSNISFIFVASNFINFKLGNKKTSK